MLSVETRWWTKWTKISALRDLKGYGLEDYGIVVAFNGAMMEIDRKYNILEVQLIGC